MKNRPVRGKKNPSETTLASWFAMGFLRFFSTDIREENVRILRICGPVSLSAKSAARGAIMVLERWVESLSTAVGGNAFVFDGIGVE